MPPIKEISFDKGIKIVGDGIPSVDIAIADFPKVPPGEAEKEREMEGILTRDLQANYEVKILLSDIAIENPDDRVLQDPPILLPCERIEKIAGKNYLITIRMFVEVHIYSVNPLKYNICCSDNPITGEWW